MSRKPVQSKYKGRPVLVVIPLELFEDIESITTERRASEHWRRVSRNEVICDLLTRGVRASEGATPEKGKGKA